LRLARTMVTPKTKFDVLNLKSAAELLYFQREYAQALEVGERALTFAMNEETYIGVGDRSEVEALVGRCRRRLEITDEQ